MQHDQLKELCRSFCQLVGCSVEEKDPELWVVGLTPELQRRHRTATWTWCFHRELLDRVGGAQLIAPGSPALRMIQETLKGSGVFAEVAFACQTEVPSGVPASMRAVNGSLTLTRARLVYRSLVRLQFRATRIGSDPCEEYFPVTLDAQTQKVADDTLTTLLRQYELAGAGREPDSKTQGIQHRPLLKKAYTEAESRLAPLLGMWDKQARSNLAEEFAQAESYFDERIQAEADPSRRTEFTRLKQQRLAEIEQRNRVSVQLEALSATLYRLPLARLEISLVSGSRSQVFALDQDLLSKEWGLPTCAHHTLKKLDTIALCSEHGLVCQACHWMCTSCQTPSCTKCPGVVCQTCQQKHCQGCIDKCTACGKKHCHRSLTECGSGCGAVCSGCAVAYPGSTYCQRCTLIASCGHRTLKTQVSACCESAQETFCPACTLQGLRPCGKCRRPACSGHRLDCAHCKGLRCTQCLTTLTDGRKVCEEHAASCTCGRRELSSKVGACHACQQAVCVTCVTLVPGPNGPLGVCGTCAYRAGCGHFCLKTEVQFCSFSKASFCPACAQVQLKNCRGCSRKLNVVLFSRCAGGGEELCPSCLPYQLADGRKVCPEHSRQCACGRTDLRENFRPCAEHKNKEVCPQCLKTCFSCQKAFCPDCSPYEVKENLYCCRGCLIKCAGCGRPGPRSRSVDCTGACGARLCSKCASLTAHVKNGLTGPVCPGCATQADCGHVTLRDLLVRCRSGESYCPVCFPALKQCSRCRLGTCSTHSRRCVEGELVCSKCVLGNMPDGRPLCLDHGVRCGACGTLNLHGHATWSCCSCDQSKCLYCSSRSCGRCRGKVGLECVVECSSGVHVGDADLCRKCASLCPDCPGFSCQPHFSECYQCAERVCWACKQLTSLCRLCSSLKPSRAINVLGLELKDRLRGWGLQGQPYQLAESPTRAVLCYRSGMSIYYISVTRHDGRTLVFDEFRSGKSFNSFTKLLGSEGTRLR